MKIYEITFARHQGKPCVAGVERRDAGAAKELINVTPQLGGPLGLNVLVAVFSAAGSISLDARTPLALCVEVSLAVEPFMLAPALIVALALALALIVRPDKKS